MNKQLETHIHDIQSIDIDTKSSCSNGCNLKYATTNRNGYMEYKSNPNDCKDCPYKYKCTQSKTNTKIITLHVFFKYMNLVENYRLQYKNIYKERSQTIERIFADGKENHNLRYTRLKGIQKVIDEITFKFACMNLKKLATWIDKNNKENVNLFIIYRIFKICLLLAVCTVSTTACGKTTTEPTIKTSTDTLFRP